MSIDRDSRVERRLLVPGTSVRRTLRPEEINEHDWAYIVQEGLEDKAWDWTRLQRQAVWDRARRASQIEAAALYIPLVLLFSAGTIVGIVMAMHGNSEAIVQGILAGTIFGLVLGAVCSCIAHLIVGVKVPRQYDPQERTNTLLSLLVLQNFWKH